MTFLLAFDLGSTEMTILLVILLILFAGARIPRLFRAMRNESDARDQDEAWSQSSKSDEPFQFNSPLLAITVIGGFAIWFLLLLIQGDLTMKQTLIGWGVLSIWTIVWWFCFGRSKE